MADEWLFPVSFYFLVDFQKMGVHFQVSFTEVSGLDMKLETRKESNDSGTYIKMPEKFTYGNITVKRPVTLIGVKDDFTKWINKCFTADKGKLILPYDAIIKLLDSDKNPVAGWKCSCAYPIQWTLNELKAQESGLAIETVVLTCNRIERITK